MQAADIATLTTTTLWAGFALTALLGVLIHRSHFCTMGAISDVVNMGDWTRARQWAMAVGVAMIGFASLVGLGLIDPSKTLYYSLRLSWLSAIVGGLMFGLGMVLASGCGSKTLVRIGAGNLKSLVVFGVMGVAAFATLKGLPAVLRVATVDAVALDLPASNSIANWLVSGSGGQISLKAAYALIGGIGGVLCLAWALRSPQARQADNLVGGLGVGGIVIAMWWISGKLGYVAEHPDTLQEAFLATNSGRIESLSFVAPIAYSVDWFMFFSDKSKVLTLGIVSVFGMIAGSAVDAITRRCFRWEGFGSVEDLANHLVGACLMGIGGITAMGCTIGQGLSGLSTLSANSVIAVVAIIAGALLAFKYQNWRIEHMV